MRTKFTLAIVLFSTTAAFAQTDSATIKNIFNEALANGKSYSNLDYLSNKIGGRLSGSPQAQQAVDWAFKAMKEAGADTVFLQECMVPHWVRGEKEVGKIISSGGKGIKEVPICALGGSIATPIEGITAQVVEVNGIEELEKIGKEKIQGKIVFYNQPMDPTFVETFNAYGKAVKQRFSGASEAVKYGAIAVIVRSCSLVQDDNPHTGVMGYKDSLHKIPACAISTNAANWMSTYLKTDKELKFFLKMNCKTLPDEKSYNVIGEIYGAEKKDEFIVVGGHLDSWDTGTGAHDDGAGIVQSIEVIRIYKALGLKPKCTIRAVAFMNEENGGRGGKKYAEIAKLKNEKHIVAMESDAGGFTPRGFSSDATPSIKSKLLSWRPLLEPYGVYDLEGDGGGSDIEPMKALGIPLMELRPDSQRYFDFHHTPIDRFEAINKRELELGGASMASMIWLISEYGLH
ncbi:MAG: M20/M25/M40 family metallo-hydrolase [Bacteroidetes bacterium]|nr:M20/M25/M40 family metallo-hydrolase [Bacteroidota bacterium]